MIIRADSRRIPLPDGSVQCVVTSPPYWGLRAYSGLEPLVWDGKEGCEHDFTTSTHHRGGGQPGDKKRWQHTGAGPSGHPAIASAFCRRCDAWRGHLGLEPTPELYVEHMVEVFREVRRVLRDDGVCFLNLGDSYASAWACHRRNVIGNGPAAIDDRMNMLSGSLKEKDLVGIPWRVAFALQADGWWLRSDIIWSKPNPMPESVEDRPTKAHEYVFLLAKSEKYFWDGEAVRERGEGYGRSERFRSDKYTNNASFENSRDWNGKSKGGGKALCDASGRNIRTVWTIPTHPFPEAHFATYPPALVERCIRAGTSERGCCPKCGAAWRRVVEKTNSTRTFPDNGKGIDERKADGTNGRAGEIESRTTGWQPTCACVCDDVAVVPGEPDNGRPMPFDPIPCTVLDPFAGSGTTVLVARRLGRRGIGVELSREYCAMARRRIDAEWDVSPVVRVGDKQIEQLDLIEHAREIEQ